MAATMKAVNYAGPNSVKVSEVEKPKLEHPDDIIVKVTTVWLLSRNHETLQIELTLSQRLQYADLIYTCTKAELPQNLVSHSVR